MYCATIIKLKMANVHYLIAGSAIILLVLAQGGFAIKCYECNSHNDPRCAEKIPPGDLAKDCSDHKNGAKYSFCRKITQIIEFSVNGLPPDTRTIRSCGYEEGQYKNRCYQRSGFGGRQEVCACDTDTCNGAVTMKATFGVLLASLVVFIARA
ncbi:hypothetical protein PVAND_004818 [Polypedilum vanderplanki]|uniref:Protein sleepless n=1 Tax=Polypedilum vanderplanki TaxID=319348 RepID=A0A9J6BY29_POLVA|nr:hypothetical protein PVAND_004818 [Polypedilum vanderplanki]